MTARRYLTTGAAPHQPTTAGTWSDSSNRVYVAASGTKSGAQTTVSDSETSTSTTWRMLLMSIVVPITASGTIQTTDIISIRYGRSCNVAASFAGSAYIWVTSGATSTKRGVLLRGASDPTPFDGTTAWSVTTPAFSGITTSALSTNLAVTAGDFLIIELGPRAVTTVSTSRTATMYYGGTDPDSQPASGAPTDTPTTPAIGWIDFTGDIEPLIAEPAPTGGQFLPFFGMGHHDEPRDDLAARRAVRRSSGLYIPRPRELTVARAA